MNTLMHRLRAAVPRAPWNALRQRGSILVLTAFALPVALAGIGLSVDAGNVYLHKSQLQNATDAAALGGAQKLAKTLPAGTETVSDNGHLTTDSFAKTYIYDEDQPATANLSEDAAANLSDVTYKAWDSTEAGEDNVVYYRVEAKQDIPLLFMKYFGIPETHVSTRSTAAIAFTGGDGKINNLFIFKTLTEETNTINNPENFDIKGQIVNRFKGRISITDGSGKDLKSQYPESVIDSRVKYSNQADQLKYFFTDEAGKNESVNEAIQNGHAMKVDYIAYDLDSFGKKVGQMTRVDYRTAVKNDLDNVYINNTVNTMKNTSSNQAIYIGGAGNCVLKIGQLTSTSTNKNEPLYIYVDSDVSQTFNIEMEDSNERPVVVCYMGTRGINFEGHGKNFRGILYAPYCENIHTNTANSTFEGTIITDNLFLNGNPADYKYYDFGVLGGSGTSGTTNKYGGTATVHLVL